MIGEPPPGSGPNIGVTGMPSPPRLPALPAPYDVALHDTIAYIQARFEPLAIIASGTIIRGAYHASSDLDLVVIHEQPWRQRVQRVFHDVAAEMFVNPPFQVRRAFSNDARNARPVMAHMLATGVVVLDTANLASDLQQEAKAVLEAGPQVDAAWLELRRYAVATAFEDAEDLVTDDPERSKTLALHALTEAITWWFPANGLWQPRSKDLLAEFERHRPELGALARMAIEDGSLSSMLEGVAPILQATIGATGFYPWESEPEALTP